MATIDKDFKVKNGIQVAGDGVFNGNIIAAAPTQNNHVVTLGYLDTLASAMEFGAYPPESPENGQLWFDTIVERVNVFYENNWRTIATIDDTLNIPDHIHDTSIDGNGLIVTRFVDAGSIFDPQGTSVDAGDADTTDWTDTWSGGIAVDNFN
jgi:hypothetical protein